MLYLKCIIPERDEIVMHISGINKKQQWNVGFKMY